jgi:hypothetical protein
MEKKPKKNKSPLKVKSDNRRETVIKRVMPSTIVNAQLGAAKLTINKQQPVNDIEFIDIAVKRYCEELGAIN